MAYGKQLLYDLLETYEIMPFGEFRSACETSLNALSRINIVGNDMHQTEYEFFEYYGDWEAKREIKESKLTVIKERVAEIEAELKTFNP